MIKASSKQSSTDKNYIDELFTMAESSVSPSEQLSNLFFQDEDEYSRVSEKELVELVTLGVLSVARAKVILADKQTEQLQRVLATAKTNIAGDLKASHFAPTSDRVVFIATVWTLMAFAFFLGRYPETYYFNFVNIFSVSLLIFRFVHYGTNGYHMFLTDFCYVCNLAILYYINFAPKDLAMFKICFVLALGPCTASQIAFMDKLVLHKHEYLTNLCVHFLPMVTMAHIRWNVIPLQEATIADPADRRFVDTIPVDYESWSNLFGDLSLCALPLYVAWNVTYGFACFVLAGKKVSTFEWPSLYQYFWKTWWSIWIFERTKRWIPSPIVFLVFHFKYIIVAHFFAIGSYFSASFTLVWCSLAFTMVLNVGANYYRN